MENSESLCRLEFGLRLTKSQHNFIFYWISDAFSISNWRIGASLVAIGLSWKLALVAVMIGNFITALVVTFNGVIGEYHLQKSGKTAQI
jgi:cytosine/uracil/thiamine/allantoin permease